ncbi:Uncharacterised protein g11388, partial [Pycnogonum litorale]
ISIKSMFSCFAESGGDRLLNNATESQNDTDGNRNSPSVIANSTDLYNVTFPDFRISTAAMLDVGGESGGDRLLNNATESQNDTDGNRNSPSVIANSTDLYNVTFPDFRISTAAMLDVGGEYGDDRLLNNATESQNDTDENRNSPSVIANSTDLYNVTFPDFRISTAA